MNRLPDFKIEPKGEIAACFLARGMPTFHQAIHYIRHLPYGRNSDKDDLRTIFTDNKGTCSTKHAVLKQLCIEHQVDDVALFIGIFKMNAQNTPAISQTLSDSGLPYLPEAHTYLKYGKHYFDFTTVTSSPADFMDFLLFEIAIQPNEINRDKIKLHQAYLTKWLAETQEISLSLEEVWCVRELCIQDLSM
ncbi:hypothetical protein PQ465_10850 [Sphingobacterium oryzagri]|uniref:Uncharacterized protein n=1 Tax=Sphingobacterium oryzagri TaxID=3025669 RepID=A0ABY7WAW7_9SPHI|nr:hypothetical protein [Sphingobacterium sp. KACC 22765]WDF66802.1 hypothetical protein PQ465_10850 [Sphingobacterium sp. KACC 22765]